MGITNERSIAYEIAKQAAAAGAELCLTYAHEKLAPRLEPIAKELSASLCLTCDVSDDAAIEKTMADVKAAWGNIDFIVHAIAFAHKDELRGGITNTTREGFHLAMDVSAYSFLAVTKAALPLLNDGASLITLTYLGSNKVVPNYNIMGVAKAALESTTRYLAAELGPRNIRVNALSAGPINTLAARGIGGFNEMLAHHERTAPLRRLTTQEDVAGAALYFLSPLSQGVTGEVHYIDGGANTLGPTPAL